MIKFVPQPQLPYIAALVRTIMENHVQDEHGERVWVTLMDGGIVLQAGSRAHMSCYVTQYGAVSVQLLFRDGDNDFKSEVKITDLTETALSIIGFFTNEWTVTSKLQQHL